MSTLLARHCRVPLGEHIVARACQRPLALVALCVALLAVAPVVAARAYAQVLDPDATGSITLDLSGSSADGSGGLVGGSVALYHVAGVNVQDGAHYDIGAGQFAESKTAAKIPELDAKRLDAENATLAQELADEAAQRGAKPSATASIESKRAAFPALKPGLYLLVQAEASEGGRGIRPFLLSVPDAQGTLDVVARPKPGLTEATEAPERNGRASSTSRTTSATSRRSTPLTADPSVAWLPALLLAALALASARVVRRTATGE